MTFSVPREATDAGGRKKGGGRRYHAHAPDQSSHLLCPTNRLSDYLPSKEVVIKSSQYANACLCIVNNPLRAVLVVYRVAIIIIKKKVEKKMSEENFGSH